MPSLNKIMIIGYLGRDVEMRFAPSGQPTTSFSVATSRRYKKNDEWQEDVEWFSVVTWAKLAETCNQILSKGSLVYVEGRQQTRNWEDKDGVKHYKTELIANKVDKLDKTEKAEDLDILPF